VNARGVLRVPHQNSHAGGAPDFHRVQNVVEELFAGGHPESQGDLLHVVLPSHHSVLSQERTLFAFFASGHHLSVIFTATMYTHDYSTLYLLIRCKIILVKIQITSWKS
jgi:hypothetical protein